MLQISIDGSDGSGERQTARQTEREERKILMSEESLCRLDSDRCYKSGGLSATSSVAV